MDNTKELRPRDRNVGRTLVRSTQAQMSYLIKFMASHPRLANGRFNGPQGRKHRKELYETVRARLRKLGPDKTVCQWEQTWRDIRRRAMRSEAKVQAAQRAPGNVVPVPVLEQYSKVLSIMGQDSDLGNGEEETETYSDTENLENKSKKNESVARPLSPLNDDEESMVADILGRSPQESEVCFEEVIVGHKPFQEEFHNENVKYEFIETLEDEEDDEDETPVTKKRKIDEQCQESDTSNPNPTDNNEFKKQMVQQFADLKNEMLKYHCKLYHTTKSFESNMKKLQDNVTKLTETVENQTKVLESIKNQPCTCTRTIAKMPDQTQIPILNKPIKILSISKYPKSILANPATVVASTSSQVQIQDGGSVQSSANSSPINRTEVQKSPHKSNFLRGAAPPGTISLEAAESMRYFHIFYIKAGTKHEQIKEYLTSLCNEDVCSVETLKARGNYASFKIGVPPRLADKVVQPENWPADVCLKPWHKNFRDTRRTTE